MFPDLNSPPFVGEQFQTNLIRPEPTIFLSCTIATLAQKKGTVKDVQGVLRHTRAATTTDVYMQEIPKSVQADGLIVESGFDIELINPALVLSVVVGLATRHDWSEASGVPGRVKVERRRQKQISSPPMGGLWEIQTLSGWGARYTAKQARR
jgi:hypothetical protein